MVDRALRRLVYQINLPMANVYTREIRSKNMAAIKSKNTKPEMLVRSFLRANGFRYKLYDKKLPGKLDIVLPKIQNRNLCTWLSLT